MEVTRFRSLTHRWSYTLEARKVLPSRTFRCLLEFGRKVGASSGVPKAIERLFRPHDLPTFFGNRGCRLSTNFDNLALMMVNFYAKRRSCGDDGLWMSSCASTCAIFPNFTSQCVITVASSFDSSLDFASFTSHLVLSPFPSEDLLYFWSFYHPSRAQ